MGFKSKQLFQRKLCFSIIRCISCYKILSKSISCKIFKCLDKLFWNSTLFSVILYDHGRGQNLDTAHVQDVCRPVFIHSVTITSTTRLFLGGRACKKRKEKYVWEWSILHIWEIKDIFFIQWRPSTTHLITFITKLFPSEKELSHQRGHVVF